MITYSALGSVGRLGNHLFQIASVIGIAEELKTEAGFPSWKYEPYFEKPLPHYFFPNVTQLKESSYHHDTSFLNGIDPKKNYDIWGYLQSERYWKNSGEKVRQQFAFKPEFKETIRKRYEKIFEKPTLAISVRRGDFVNNSNYYQIPLTYYLYAYYQHFGSDYNVIVFSDDFKYCKFHFKAIPNVVFADDLKDIEQLCLMSMCENHIISNSTFSWWGAYLSGSKNVIRPVKNLAGELEKTSDEKDYWLKEWKVFEPGRYDLTNVTFVIPVYHDHEHRRQNLLLAVAFLLRHFKTNIIIGEQGGGEYQFLQSWCDYLQFSYKEWHRTRMINKMCLLAKTNIVVNWDCDNMLSPVQIIEAAKAIANGADIVYPFDGNVYRVPRYLFGKVVKSLDAFDIDTNQCRHPTDSSVGHGLFMNKESFIAAGMENENFISWGPEDSERYDRFNILGLKVQRIKGAIYHMDHYIGETSSSTNQFFATNRDEHNKVKLMDKPELESYIKTWKR